MILAPHTIIIGVSVLVLYLSYKVFRKPISIATVRGPPSPSWLLGHLYMLRHTKNLGDYETAWHRDYGSVVRIAGIFSRPILVVSDPKALQYILQTSGYQFPKSLDADRLANTLFGYGLGAATGRAHQRQRKILNPAFSSAHLRSYLGIFQANASKLVGKLKAAINNGDEIQDMLSWTKKVALDIIGTASFRYSFGALDNVESSLRETLLSSLFADAQLFPSALEVFSFHGVLQYLPESLMTVMAKFPTRESLVYRRYRREMEYNARTIYHRERQLVKDGIEEEKDVINILALSSLSDDESKKMSEEEIIAQMATFVFAGHDSTANEIAWLLYELSRHPEDQKRIRQEILQVRHDKDVLTSSDYDAMPFLNAVIKETLRLHPFAHTLSRVAQHDDVLPLSQPIVTSDGKLLKEIPISKGQTIRASIYMYNRNPAVWGDDANEWNPSRFLKDDHLPGDTVTNVSVFSNLLTFSSGVRSCIGWRFAIMELQTISVELLSSLQFSAPKNVPPIVHGPGSITMFPLIEGRPQDGMQLPLQVSIVEEKA